MSRPPGGRWEVSGALLARPAERRSGGAALWWRYGHAHHVRVSSALEEIGLTAAVSRMPADAGISCNVITGAAHDRLFVDWLGDIALALIRQL